LHRYARGKKGFKYLKRSLLMNRQVLILVAAACTTALWSFVHTANNPGAVMPHNITPTQQPQPTTPLAHALREHFDTLGSKKSKPTNEILKVQQIAEQYKVHPDIEKQMVDSVTQAYHTGLQAGFKASGQALQMHLNAVADSIKTMQPASH